MWVETCSFNKHQKLKIVFMALVYSFIIQKHNGISTLKTEVFSLLCSNNDPGQCT
jgi:hypothetical protein